MRRVRERRKNSQQTKMLYVIPCPFLDVLLYHFVTDACDPARTMRLMRLQAHHPGIRDGSANPKHEMA
jgi:hypothetical protein